MAWAVVGRIIIHNLVSDDGTSCLNNKLDYSHWWLAAKITKYNRVFFAMKFSL